MKNFTTHFVPSFCNERSFYGFLFLVVLWILYSKKNIVSLVTLLGMTILVNLYFYYNGRYLYNRVDMVVWLMSGIIIVYLIADKQEKYSLERKSVICLLAIVTLLYLKSDIPGIKENRYKESFSKNAQEFISCIHEDIENIYITSVDSDKSCLAYQIFDLPEKGILKNYHPLGGWETNTPITNSVLREYGMYNLYRDMVDNPNAFLIDNGEVMIKILYIQERYAPEAKAALVKDIYGNKIYRVVTSEPNIRMEDVITNANDVYSSFDCFVEGGSISVNGFAYKDNINSWKQEFYTIITNKKTGQQNVYYSVQSISSDLQDLYHGKYGAYGLKIDIDNQFEKGQYKVSQILNVDDNLYLVGEEVIAIESAP